jgi:tetratricopeptide (TPR) repeat protein
MGPRAALLIGVALAVLAVLALGAISSDVPAAPRPLRMAPLGQDRRPTTAGTIFLGNLESQLGWVQKEVEREPDSVHAQRMLASLLATRGKYRGDIEQIQEALDAVDTCLEIEPNNADLWLERAGHAQALHRFAEARDDVEHAVALGARGRNVDDLVQELDWNDGNYVAAIASIRGARSSFAALARVAQLEHDLGNMEAADRAFEAAEDRMADVSPLPLAWLYVERGRHELDRGETARAVAFLREAVARAPGYIPAEEHLAEALNGLGHTDEAIARYRNIVERSPDPEFMGALAALLREAGNTKEADRLAARARAGYEELLRRWPEAMYWHAAEFFLGEGKDPKRALALLEKNIAVRPNGESWAALARAQRANGDERAARFSMDMARATPIAFAYDQ